MSETNYSLATDDAGTFKAPDIDFRPPKPKSYRPNIGLIACGGITAHHLDAYRTDGYPVVALCDLDITKAEARRAEFFPEADVYSDYMDVLRRDDIEVVDVAAHPAQRTEIVREAIKAGKHVLSQKPFVLNLDEGQAIVDLARILKRKLAVNQNGRWSPHFAYMRGAVQSGVIGEVLSVHMSMQWNHDWTSGTAFDEIKHLVLYDFAIHWFDALSTLVGDKQATRVFASTAHAAGQKAKPDLLGQALVEFEGAQATLVFDAFSRFGSRDRTVIVGTKGMLRSEGPGLGDQTITLVTEEGTASPVLDGSWFNDGFRGTMGELLSAIEEDREPQNSAQQNLKGLAMCFAALRSADTGLPQVPGEVRSV